MNSKRTKKVDIVAGDTVDLEMSALLLTAVAFLLRLGPSVKTDVDRLSAMRPAWSVISIVRRLFVLQIDFRKDIDRLKSFNYLVGTCGAGNKNLSDIFFDYWNILSRIKTLLAAHIKSSITSS